MTPSECGCFGEEHPAGDLPSRVDADHARDLHRQLAEARDVIREYLEWCEREGISGRYGVFRDVATIAMLQRARRALARSEVPN